MPVTHITKARVVLTPFTGEQMTRMGNALLKSIKNRIRHGLTIEDLPAKPLHIGKKGKMSYAQWKAAHGLQGVRYLTKTGRLMRSLAVTQANENRAVIECADAREDKVLHINNQVSRQFGVSPTDRQAAAEAFRREMSNAILVKTA